MKLHPDKPGTNAITGVGSGWIAVNGERQFTHLWLDSQGPWRHWQGDPQAPWDADTMNAVAQRAPELLILGSGERQRFAPPAALQPLMAARIGFETMDTAAACRTYNILAGEGRDVLALLVLPPVATA